MSQNLTQANLNRAEKALNTIQENAGSRVTVLSAVYDYYQQKERNATEPEKVCDWCGKPGGKIKILHDRCYNDIMDGAGIC